MTKSIVLPAAMLMAMLAPALAQTASPEIGSTTGATTATTTLGSPTRVLTVDALGDMDLVGADGKEIGDIEGMVENNADKKQFVVLERGGFLGLGAKKTAVPLENLAVQGEKVTLRNMDVAQLDGMAEFENDNNAYRELGESQQITLPQQ
jgi:hypothetical protein